MKQNMVTWWRKNHYSNEPVPDCCYDADAVGIEIEKLYTEIDEKQEKMYGLLWKCLQLTKEKGGRDED